jgi:hypothetical protein
MEGVGWREEKRREKFINREADLINCEGAGNLNFLAIAVIRSSVNSTRDEVGT